MPSYYDSVFDDTWFLHVIVDHLLRTSEIKPQIRFFSFVLHWSWCHVISLKSFISVMKLHAIDLPRSHLRECLYDVSLESLLSNFISNLIDDFTKRKVRCCRLSWVARLPHHIWHTTIKATHSDTYISAHRKTFNSLSIERFFYFCFSVNGISNKKKNHKIDRHEFVAAAQYFYLKNHKLYFPQCVQFKSVARRRTFFLILNFHAIRPADTTTKKIRFLYIAKSFSFDMNEKENHKCENCATKFENDGVNNTSTTSTTKDRDEKSKDEKSKYLYFGNISVQRKTEHKKHDQKESTQMKKKNEKNETMHTWQMLFMGLKGRNRNMNFNDEQSTEIKSLFRVHPSKAFEMEQLFSITIVFILRHFVLVCDTKIWTKIESN